MQRRMRHETVSDIRMKERDKQQQSGMAAK